MDARHIPPFATTCGRVDARTGNLLCAVLISACVGAVVSVIMSPFMMLTVRESQQKHNSIDSTAAPIPVLRSLLSNLPKSAFLGNSNVEIQDSGRAVIWPCPVDPYRRETDCGAVSELRYIIADLGQLHVIHEVQTQGLANGEQMVTVYELKYSLDGKTWSFLRDRKGDFAFRGNYDHSSILSNRYFEPFVARFVRLDVVAFKGYRRGPAMRWAVLGLPLE